MSNPFDDSSEERSPENSPSLPNAAFTDRYSPRRYQQNNSADQFFGYPSQFDDSRQSPNIFTRSANFRLSTSQHDDTSSSIFDNRPNLQFGSNTQAFGGSPTRSGSTARAGYTLRESPKRAKQTEVIILDDDVDTRRSSAEDRYSFNGSPRHSNSSRFTRSTNSNRSERFLSSPKPIFSPETFAEANSEVPLERVDTERTIHDDEDDNEYEYTKNLGEKQLLYATGTNQDTLYDGEMYRSHDEDEEGDDEDNDIESHGNLESDYFGESIDGNIMNTLAHGYVPNSEKVISKRKVRLIGGKTGNLVLENPIPEELKKFLPRTESQWGEFTNMTYTACTAEPDDFLNEGFTLRAAKYGRETEIVICITMYNEDEKSFARTMHGVMKNVAHLCSRHKSRIWGKDSWKKVQVIIISDGRNKIDPSVLELLTATGCYQDNLARPYVNNKEVKAHLFEYTTQISIDENLKFKGDEKNLAPVQVLFCLKEKNCKKINSHRWLFNAFCPILVPNVCVLLDVGTKPDNHAVYHLWKAFDNDSNIAGAAGEIRTLKGKGWVNLMNPLVASQNFEYKMSNILDKPLESVFGYISVLPGALSAYRYIALTNHEDGTGPLASYFKGEELLREKKVEGISKNRREDFFEANMYLAEDRILCWELVAKRQEKWVLKYVKSATGETDVPDTIAEFISQRRRWINGAFFAALYSLVKFKQIWRTDHSFTRKFFLHVEFFYQFVSLVFSFFSLSNFYLTFYFLTGSLVSNKHIPHNGGFWIFTIFKYICLCDLAAIFVISIGNRPQASRKLFFGAIATLTLCAAYALVVGLYFVASTIQGLQEGTTSEYVFFTIVVSLLSTYGLYTLMSILYLDPWHMFTCSLQYFLMIPSYTCTLQIYAFCNTHDVSWGTKGDNDPKADKSNQYIIEKNAEGEFEAVVVDVNMDEVYLDALYNIRTKRSNAKVKQLKAPPAEMSGEDYAKDVRTKVVLIWLIVNMVFVMIMTQVYSAGDTNNNIYLAFILWSVAFLSLFRAIGSFTYLIQIWIRFAIESKSKVSRNNGYTKPKFNLNPFSKD